MASPKTHWFLLSLFFLSLNTSSLSFASDHISFENSLSGNKTIISQGGRFELGFFQPGNKTVSGNYYLGIWYKKVNPLTPVWIANRNVPITDPRTSEFKISNTGNVVLLDQNKTQIWSTNLTSLNTNSTICILQNTGNLVLQDSSDPTTIIWQSLDHPANTWLSGGKLGKNKATGRQRLVSWKSNDDPAEGLFSLEIDPNGTSQYFFFWNKSKPYWSSGEWNGKYFNNIPEMATHSRYNFTFVTNENKTYVSYWLLDDTLNSRLVMDLSGQIKMLAWLEISQEWILLWSRPQAQCDVYALCGPFGSCNEKSLPYCSCVKGFTEVSSTDWELNDMSGGCKRNYPLQCTGNNGSLPSDTKDRFFSMTNMGLPDDSHSLENISAEDCESACLKNCSCNAYSYSGTNCSVWYGNLLNLKQESDGSSGVTLYLRLSASEFKKSESKTKGIIWVVIGSVIGILSFAILIFLLIWVYERRRLLVAMSASENSLIAFRYGDLKRLTNNFSERLGGGSFGSVFKGTLPNSNCVAVKRLEGSLQLGEKQFRNEVSTIGTIQHVNLVRLRGFCSERDKRLLVYDYMPHGALNKILFQGNNCLLHWHTRYQIALGAARGLAYLHESCRNCIIHCDIKPENILLDELFVPKVADFGMAKLFGREFSRVLTTFRGTIGYLAPEWISGVPITVKTDVYSYGMVLFEIISGRRNSEKLKGEICYFPLLAATKLNEGNAFALLDHQLNGNANPVEVERACRVACWCIQDEEHNRPTMGQVVQILEGVLEVGMPPIPSTLQAFRDSDSLDLLSGHSLGWQNSQVESTASSTPGI